MNSLSYKSTPEGAVRMPTPGQGPAPAAPTPADPRMTRRGVGLLIEVTQAAKLLTVGALTFGLTLTACWPLRFDEPIWMAM